MRFIHTADWQIGMKRHFLDEDAQARFSGARENVIRRIGQLAGDLGAEFVGVAGDVFETSLLRPRTVRRALDAMKEIPVPVYLLPGNHDPLGAASIYDSPEFLRYKPDQVHVLHQGETVTLDDGTEIIGVPWMSKQMVEDQVGQRLLALGPTTGQFRIMLGHGATLGMGSHDALGIINLEGVEEALRQGKIHYLGLGDRHSTTNCSVSGRIWYSGAPEPTEYDEVDSGNVLLVELTAGAIEVTPIATGTWRFVEKMLDVEPGQAESRLESFLSELPGKAETIVKINFRGTITMLDQMGLDRTLEDERQSFGAIERHVHRDHLAVLPESGEMEADMLTGFARQAFDQLVQGSGLADPQGQQYRDALALYYRLMKEV